MKKIKYILLFFLTLSLTFTLTSCIDDDNPPIVINPGGNEDNPGGGDEPIIKPDPKENPETKDVDGTTINVVRISLDTKAYTGNSLNELYTVEVSHDSNYTYIYAVVKATNGYKFNKDVITYVNEVKDEGHVTLNESLTELTYRIKDPNWTPIY